MAYFLDPNERHNFRTLFWDSLLDIVGDKKSEINIDKDFYNDFYIQVNTEKSTNEQKRIDIALIGSNISFGIENKVDAPLNNRLDLYLNEIEKESEHNNCWIIVLSCKTEDKMAAIVKTYEYETDNSKKTKFEREITDKIIYIKHDELFKAVETRFTNNLISDAEPRSLEIYKQYYENMSEERNKMTQEIIDKKINNFLEKIEGNEQNFLNFFKDLSDFTLNVRQKITALKDAVNYEYENDIWEWSTRLKDVAPLIILWFDLKNEYVFDVFVNYEISPSDIYYRFHKINTNPNKSENIRLCKLNEPVDQIATKVVEKMKEVSELIKTKKLTN